MRLSHHALSFYKVYYVQGKQINQQKRVQVSPGCNRSIKLYSILSHENEKA